jgi:hypothetical protein
MVQPEWGCERVKTDPSTSSSEAQKSDLEMVAREEAIIIVGGFGGEVEDADFAARMSCIVATRTRERERERGGGGREREKCHENWEEGASLPPNLPLPRYHCGSKSHAQSWSHPHEFNLE